MKPQEKTKVVRAVPSVNKSDLYHTMDGYEFIYETTAPHSKVDVAVPGFFNIWRDELRVGMVIECRLGPIADGITQVWLQVIAAPKNDIQGDVMVSVGPSKSFTPCRHDGSLTKEKAA